MSTLNQIILMSQDIERRLIESDGQLTDEIQKDLELNDSLLPDKIDAYVYAINSLESKVDFISKRIEDLKSLEGSYLNNIDFLKSKLQHTIDILHLEKLMGSHFTVGTILNPPKVIISDESLIPDAYKITKTVVTTSVDKIRLQEVLKNGIPIEGATLTRGKKLVIKENIWAWKYKQCLNKGDKNGIKIRDGKNL